jgi:fumarate reductase subunit D
MTDLIRTLLNIGSGIPSNGFPKISADSVLVNALNIIYFVGGIIAVVVIIIAGYTFTTGVYDQQKITQAKNAILYAVVGLVAIMFAFVITQFIIGRF